MPVAVRIEAHRLGIDRDHRAEADVRGQIVPMEVDRRIGLKLSDGHSPTPIVGAQEKTRTFTSFRTQVPETCASTNSATWACTGRAVERRCSPGLRGRQSLKLGARVA